MEYWLLAKHTPVDTVNSEVGKAQSLPQGLMVQRKYPAIWVHQSNIALRATVLLRAIEH